MEKESFRATRLKTWIEESFFGSKCGECRTRSLLMPDLFKGYKGVIKDCQGFCRPQTKRDFILFSKWGFPFPQLRPLIQNQSKLKEKLFGQELWFWFGSVSDWPGWVQSVLIFPGLGRFADFNNMVNRGAWISDPFTLHRKIARWSMHRTIYAYRGFNIDPAAYPFFQTVHQQGNRPMHGDHGWLWIGQWNQNACFFNVLLFEE